MRFSDGFGSTYFCLLWTSPSPIRWWRCVARQLGYCTSMKREFFSRVFYYYLNGMYIFLCTHHQLFYSSIMTINIKHSPLVHKCLNTSTFPVSTTKKPIPGSYYTGINTSGTNSKSSEIVRTRIIFLIRNLNQLGRSGLDPNS